MVQTERKRSLAKQATAVIIAHTILYIVYSYAHEKVDLMYNLSAYIPLLLLFCFLPVAATSFLSTRFARQGSIVLLGTLPAVLIYNVVTRFNATLPILGQKSTLIWIIVYEGSFGFALLLEVIGFWLTFKLLREIHKEIISPAENPPEHE